MGTAGTTDGQPELWIVLSVQYAASLAEPGLAQFPSWAHLDKAQGDPGMVLQQA